MGIRNVRIGDVLELERRPVEVDPDREYKEIGVRSFGRGIFHKDPIIGSELGNKRVFYVHPGDLVFSNVFAWEGAVALAGEQEDGRIGSHRFMTYRVNDKKADSRYLAYFFFSEPGLAIVRRASPGSAGRNRTLGIKNFAAQEIELPELDEQRRIATKLDRAMESCHTLSTLAPDLGREQLGSLVSGGTEKILQRWSDANIRVRDACEIVNDTVHPGEELGEATDFIGLEHIVSNLGLRTGSRPVGDEKGRKFRFAPGDILYGYLRPYLNKVWAADRPGLCSVEQYVLRPNGDVPAELLAHCLRAKSVVDAVKESTNKLQLPRLRSKRLLDFTVPYIPPDEHKHALKELNSFVARASRYVRLDSERNETVKALRSSLLNAAFSGQL